MTAAQAVFSRDLQLAWRAGGGGGLALAFFTMVVVLVPFSLGPDTALLARIAPGIIWLAATLATLLSLDRLFQADAESGSFDLLMLTPTPLELIVLAKVAAHWVATALPVVIAAPLMAGLLNLPGAAWVWLVLSLAIGTPALSLIGGIAAALTVSLRRGGLLLSLLALPLFVPVIIFGTAAATPGESGAVSALYWLGALSLFAVLIGPLAAAAALRLLLR